MDTFVPGFSIIHPLFTFLMGIGEALIGGASSLLGSIWNSTVGMNQSKQLMRYQAELNQKAVDAANRYSSPIEQIKRLREAGLNPNLVYGTGVTGNQSEAKSVGIANRNPNLDTGLLQAVETYFKRQEISNQNRMTDQQIRESLSRTALNEERTLSEMLENKWRDRTLDDRVKQASANLAHTLQSVDESKQRVDESIARVSNLHSQANLLNEQIKYWEAHANIERDWRPKEIEAHIAQMEASGELSHAQAAAVPSIIALNGARADQLVQWTKKLVFETGEAALDYKVKEKMDQLGITGLKPKDFLDLLKVIFQSLIK